MQRPAGALGASGTADQVAVRRHNLAVVTRHLRLYGAKSRARLAEDTGLNKATVSSLVAELVQRRLVSEGETERGSVGRPGLVMELDATHYVAVGVELNIDFIVIVVTNLRGEMVKKTRVALDTARMEPGLVLRRIASTTAKLLDPITALGATPVGLTLAVPGIVDPVAGIVYDAPNLGWREVPAIEPLEELLGGGFPILLDNRANVAALAELDVRGPGAARDLVLVTGAAGVGGGVVVNGELLRGARGFAGEIGHMQVGGADATCGCGRRGCWESVVGLNALLRLAAEPDDPVRDPRVDVVRRLELLHQRADAGDGRTLDAIDEVGTWLATGCGSLVNIFNPEVLVLGGYFAVLGRWFAERLADDLATHVFAPEAGGCRVETSTLGFSAGARGGALRASRAVIDDPTLVPLVSRTETR